MSNTPKPGPNTSQNQGRVSPVEPSPKKAGTNPIRDTIGGVTKRVTPRDANVKRK